MMRNICIFVSLLFIVPVCGQQSGLRSVSFMYYEEDKTWKEAQSFCREKHTDLATIRSEEENQLIRENQGWIGLYREDANSPWKWSRGDKNATFFNWDNNEPNNEKDELCVVTWNKDDWKNDNCWKKYNFLCYDENLVLVTENKTWEEALDHCRSLGGEDSENPDSVSWKPSYDLATLITEDDHDYAQERAQQATTDEVWTGLRFLGDGWFWVGGEPVQYQDIPSCPAYGCGVLEKNSNTSFGLRACSQRRNFFCYKRPENN
ncbi:macrophage mannose receptor 1-like [Melanotaenia boesemani]|uniref:macrophage mannose receptor 1-like n=1 Tax=Melanotaenia boesemani TaxID=1250792 RepID=UPI001C03BE5A|nr:macrophage mannose receptor 1-like [Melanotaenia boesemani]XP_041864703.1 macrophage mannose receptor 1-like [Melanotaenia boesemani]